ncbi:TIR domain-containing protein [Pseudomonas sp. CCOS 191]|uniref:TIR domain-containing protein n=1 Tax=Pseudomonas sp. CCOS 191 TaxID=1649877 RepID=UPI00062BB557|nr:molecular chaperone Tir [Pseudomonas sp. CCOS 191]
MSYRNKTYVAFASEDIHLYRLMEAWRDNDKIDFDFFDAHDIFQSRDTSKRETIKRNLCERMKNAKQVVLIGSPDAKRKGGDGYSFLAHEVELIIEMNLPVVVANKGGSRLIKKEFIPVPFSDADYYTISVSLQPAIIKYALDNYTRVFRDSDKKGPHYYLGETYSGLGI